MAVRGYQGFGSFHSDNVEEMIRSDKITEIHYPFGLPTEKKFGFGDIASDFFLLGDEFTFINHGAFGSPLRSGFQLAHSWREYVEKQPLKFIDRELFPFLVCAIKKFASYVNCKTHEVVFIPNATFGLNAVLRTLKPKSKVLLLDIAYGSVKKMLEALGHSVVLIKVDLKKISNEYIVNLVEECIRSNNKNENSSFDLAVFDHITSNTALVLPIKKLTNLCHNHHIKVLIDGAHSLGQIKVDFTDIGADYFVGNCHKWLCSPRGSGYIYINSNTVDSGSIHSPIITHGWGSGFTSEFIWYGNDDYTPHLTLPYIIEFWQSVGEERVKGYCSQLLQQSKIYLEQTWGVTPFAPSDMTAFMTLVELPTSSGKHLLMMV
eukprot:TRINITY_DN3157_c0_g1_i4.p1 TRINITY_DN3157_c0_g1~~TRINITY_DN3157_c0_g1_i4.p1  ORF type:complete len:384 (+),score=76.35 TRINITY_DN3157_c0_g1_i4:25-1152(+)